MTATVAFAGLLGAGTAAGLLLIIHALRGLPQGAPPGGTPVRLSGLSRWAARRTHRDGRRLAGCVAVSLVVAVATGWPVAAVLAGCAAWVLPAVIGPDRAHRRRLGRIEAIATWTESLRDTLSAAAGLEQAIVATAALAPEPIAQEVGRLAGRLRRSDRLPDALRSFAAELDDPTGDLVVTALVMAAERHARHIGDLLTSLAATAREQAAMRMRIAAARARIRTSTRVITTATAAMAVGLVLLNRGYLAPYDTAAGQLVLAVVGVLFAAGFWWLARIATFTSPPRILTVAADRPSVGVLS